MGELIPLTGRRGRRSGGEPPHASSSGPRPAFFFDLACPFSYLAIDRVEHELGEVTWIPAPAGPRRVARCGDSIVRARALAEQRAIARRLPLVWPDRFPEDCPRALRAAAHAAEVGAGARFALAASRLAFCGGFDLADPEVIAEAAAAAGLQLEDCLAAAADTARDEQLRATAQRLVAHGVRRLPAIRIGLRWFDGEARIGEAAALVYTPREWGPRQRLLSAQLWPPRALKTARAQPGRGGSPVPD